MPIKLKCHKCGKEQEYDNENEAFNDGWDIQISRITDDKTADFCGDCPSAPFLMGIEQ